MNVSPAEAIPESLTFIIDLMSRVHEIKNNGMTLALLAETNMSLVPHEGTHSQKMYVAFDVCLGAIAVVSTEPIKRHRGIGDPISRIAGVSAL